MIFNARTWTQLKKFSHVMGVKPFYFFVLGLSSLLIASLDGLSLGLIMPLGKGIIQHDFSFIKKIPILQSDLFTPLRHAPNTSLFFLLITAICFFALAKNIVEYYLGAYLINYKETCLYRIKSYIFKRYISFGKLYHDRSCQGHIGLIMGRLDFMLALFQRFAVFVIDYTTLVIYLLIICFISIKLAVLFLLIFPVLHFSMQLIIKKIEQAGQQQAQLASDASREMFNVFSCIGLVKSNSKEGIVIGKFDELLKHLREVNGRIAMRWQLLKLVHDMVGLITLLVILVIAAFVFTSGKATNISGYFLVLILARRCIPLFGSFYQFKGFVSEMKGALDQTSSVLDDDDKFYVIPGHKEFKGLSKGIEFRGLSFSYNNHNQVLKDINFLIEKSSTTAIVGSTGAGKTTLVSLVIRYYDCPTASIFFDGTDIREFTLQSISDRIAFVNQEVLLFNDTLRNNLTFGINRDVSDDELMDIAKKTCLSDFILNLEHGLNTELGDRGVKLSGGEKQRVALSRAMLKRTEILILDEATSSLDSSTEKLIQEAVNESIRGKTAIVIAHRLSTIKNADKIVVLENGMIVESGGLEELIQRKGRFYEYWQAQKFF